MCLRTKELATQVTNLFVVLSLLRFCNVLSLTHSFIHSTTVPEFLLHDITLCLVHWGSMKEDIVAAHPEKLASQ